MPIIPNVTPVTVTATYLDANGEPLNGYVTFRPTARSAGGAVVLPAPVQVDVPNGVMSVVLAASDDPNLLPNGWTYEVVENFPGSYISYNIQLTEAMAPTVVLSTIVPSVPVTPMSPYLLRTQMGQVGGPAGPLDAGGRIPAVQIGAPVVNVKDYGAKGDGSANDTAAINAALAALTPGTTLLFPPGRYMTDGNHVVNQPSVIIKGSSGRAQTYNSQAQLYLRNGANVDMLIIAANQVTVRDLSLYGNKTNQTVTSRGLVTPPTSGANYLLLDAVWVDSFNGDGFSFESSGGTLSSTISNCESRVNNGYGMRFYGTSTDSMVIGCYIDQNVQSGIFCSAGDLSLTSCHIWGNGTGNTGDLDGITFQSSAGCRVINCYIETQINGAGIRFKTGANKGHIVSGCDIWSNGLQGIYAFSASNCVFSGNVIRTNNYKGQPGSAGAGLLVDSCTAMLITGNQFFSIGASRQTYGYYELGASNVDIRFTDNMSRATDHTTGGVFLGPGTDYGDVEVLPVSSGLSWTGAVDLTSLAATARTIQATLTGNVTLTLPTPPSSVSYTVTLVLTQDATGSRTLTLPAPALSAYGVDPVLSTTAGATDLVHLLWTGAAWIALMAAPAVA